VVSRVWGLRMSTCDDAIVRLRVRGGWIVWGGSDGDDGGCFVVYWLSSFMSDERTEKMLLYGLIAVTFHERCSPKYEYGTTALMMRARHWLSDMQISQSYVRQD